MTRLLLLAATAFLITTASASAYCPWFEDDCIMSCTDPSKFKEGSCEVGCERPDGTSYALGQSCSGSFCAGMQICSGMEPRMKRPKWLPEDDGIHLFD